MGTPIWTCLECLLVGTAGVASGLWALDSVGASGVASGLWALDSVGTSGDIGKDSLIPKNIPTADIAQLLDTTNNITHDEEPNEGTGKSDCLIFVDDTKLFTQINNDSDREEHQSSLDTLYKWQEDNNMSFNNGKFLHMSFGTNTQTRDKSFYLNPENDIITQTDHARDLGVIFENNLSFSLQQQKVVQKNETN